MLREIVFTHHPLYFLPLLSALPHSTTLTSLPYSPRPSPHSIHTLPCHSYLTRPSSRINYIQYDRKIIFLDAYWLKVQQQ